MRVAVCSDLHIEFGGIELKNTDNADVLILSGDICVAKKFGPSYDAFFQDVSNEFPHVVYVMGNHEHYDGDYAKSAELLRNALERYKNVHFLDKQVWSHEGVTFIGSTLWTDMNNDDSMTKMHVARRMNDFQIVKNSSRKVTFNSPVYKTKEDGSYEFDENNQFILLRNEKKERDGHFSPEDAFEDHKKSLDFIRLMVEGQFDRKFVVVGHHAPSKLSTHPRYAHDTLMNGAYSSSLDEFIMERPQIKLWTHGHTHEDFDYMIGSTRVVCNPRGYIGYEGRASAFQLKTFEV